MVPIHAREDAILVLCLTSVMVCAMSVFCMRHPEQTPTSLGCNKSVTTSRSSMGNAESGPEFAVDPQVWSPLQLPAASSGGGWHEQMEHLDASGADTAPDQDDADDSETQF